MQAVTTKKSMRGGEVGLIAVLAIVALACLTIAVETIEPAFAFHMALGVVASAAVVALGARIGDPIIGLLITLVILKITWDSWRTVSTTEPGELIEQHEH